MSQNERYKQSNELFERAIRSVPLASQTFSKSYVQYPHGQAPLFLSHGKGATVWDVDGNEYVDLVMGLMPNVLGYCDPTIDAAIRDQLSRGITFSLATTLEMELAERLIDLIPCAEMVRYGKNGSDATSAAIRIARAATGRDRVAVCGYHGWQDWYVGCTTRNKGVPQVVSDLTHVFPYNDLPALEKLLEDYPGQFAAVMMEPMNAYDPEPGYLQGVMEMAHRAGALYIMDETITGFRFAKGGAQELFGVTPDLATFGKSMGAGMPLSAVVGKREYMMQMEEVFLSSTFGGEALSLAAAIALIDKMKSEPVIETLWERGERLAVATLAAAKKHGVDDFFTLVGKAPWKIQLISDHPTARKEVIKTILIREMLAAGILINSGHHVSAALTDDDCEKVAVAYDKSFSRLAEELAAGDLESRLDCPVIEPVFTVR